MFNEAFNPRLIKDDDFNFKMFLAGRLACIPESLVRVRMPSVFYNDIKEAQATSLHVINKLDLFFNILKEKLSDNKTVKIDEKGFSTIRSQWLMEQATGFILYENGKKIAQRLIIEAIKEKPFDYKNWKVYLRSFSQKKKVKNGEPKRLLQEDIDYLMKKEFFRLN